MTTRNVESTGGVSIPQDSPLKRMEDDISGIIRRNSFHSSEPGDDPIGIEGWLKNPKDYETALAAAMNVYKHLAKETKYPAGTLPKYENQLEAYQAASLIHLIVLKVREKFPKDTALLGKCMKALAEIDPKGEVVKQIYSRQQEKRTQERRAETSGAAGSAEKSGVLQTLGKFGKKIKGAISEDLPEYTREAFFGMHTKAPQKEKAAPPASSPIEAQRAAGASKPVKVQKLKEQELKDLEKDIGDRFVSESGDATIVGIADSRTVVAVYDRLASLASRITTEDEKKKLSGLYHKVLFYEDARQASLEDGEGRDAARQKAYHAFPDGSPILQLRPGFLEAQRRMEEDLKRAKEKEGDSSSK